MNRWEFCQCAVCAAVIAALPVRPEQPSYLTFTHDGTDVNIKFCSTNQWWAGTFLSELSDADITPLMRDAWERCK